MRGKSFWRVILKLIDSVSLSNGLLTICFKSDIERFSKNIGSLCNDLGIAIMSSPDGNREHFSIALLKKTSDGNKVMIDFPVNTNFPGFIGIEVYYVHEFKRTISRPFYMKNT